MTNEEALEILKRDIDLIMFDENTGEALNLGQIKARNELNYQSYKAYEKAIEALEKQIAKKPKKIETEGYRYTDTYKCPTCKGNFSGTGIADYCYHCGQKLDWSEYDD